VARDIGLTPKTDDPFTREWESAIAVYFRGNRDRALQHIDAADTLWSGAGVHENNAAANS
jgi:hypothetical protein